MPTDLLPALAASSLNDLLLGIAHRPQLWQPHVRFDAGSRYWHRLGLLPDADIWLLTWLPDQSTDLHDHGDSTAAFTLVTGELEETRVRPSAELARTTLRTGQRTTILAGEVHDVANRSEGPAISIHAYSPGLEAMTFWDVVPGGLRRGRTVLTDEPEVA